MSSDLRTELNDGDALTGWASDGASPGLNTDAGQRYEGTGSIDGQHTNSDEMTYTTSIGGTRDLSDSTVYVLVKDNLVETFANGGLQIGLGDATPDRIGYDVGGNDAVGLSLSPFYNCYKLDVSVIVATPGSFATYQGSEANLVQTAIVGVGVGTLHLAKAVGNVPNIFIDRMTFIANGSYALRINGGTVGTPETMADVAGDDVTNGWGMVNNPLGSQYGFFAPTEWGEPTANAAAYFTASNEQWFWIGDNSGGHAVGATHFPFRVVGNATDTISFVLDNVVIVNTGTRAQFDLSDTNVNTLQLSSVTFTDLGTITLQPQDINDKFLSNCIFNNCDKVLVSSMDIDDCTFNGSNDADGAILLTEVADTTSGTMTNLVFNSDGTGHAVHIRPTGAGPFEFDFDNWTFDGYASDAGTATDRAVYIDPVTSSANITINILNGGDTPSIREAAGYTGTVTINNAVTLKVEGVAQGSSIIIDATETVGTITTGDRLLEALADANGEASTTLSYESAFEPSGLDVVCRVRNQGFPNAAIREDNSLSAFVDQTTQANSTTTNDIDLNLGSVNDAYYFGDSEKFGRLKVNVSTAGVGTTPVIVWEYYNGTIWTALSGVTDDTNSWQNSGQNEISFTIPGDWATTSVNSQGPFYYVRARLSAGDYVTTLPLGRWVKIDTTRWLPFTQDRVITSTGLTVVVSQAKDTISEF